MKKILLIFVFVLTCSFSFAEDEYKGFDECPMFKIGDSKSEIITFLENLNATIQDEVVYNGIIFSLHDFEYNYIPVEYTLCTFDSRTDKLVAYSYFFNPSTNLEIIQLLATLSTLQETYSNLTPEEENIEKTFNESLNLYTLVLSDEQSYIKFAFPANIGNPYWIITFGEKN